MLRLHYSITPPLQYSIAPILHHSTTPIRRPDDHRPTEIFRERAKALGRTGIAAGQARERPRLQVEPGAVETFSLPLRTDLGGPGENHDVRLRAGDAQVSRIARRAGLR